MTDNPYLRGTDRLADILSAIQFLGTYRFYKVGFDYWHDRIKVDPKSAPSWEQVFRDHPEFFRVSDEERNVCLILRRARSRNFNVDTGETIARAQRKELSETERERITRAPLATSDLAVLLNVAIELHGRYIAQKQERRWYLALVAPLTALLGVIVGAKLA